MPDICALQSVPNHFAIEEWCGHVLRATVVKTGSSFYFRYTPVKPDKIRNLFAGK